MDCSSGTGKSHDLLLNPLLVSVLFCLPVIAILAAGYFRVNTGWQTVVWTVAFSIMGIACIANAARCGRVHCYLTGPFLLTMAVVTLLYGLGVISLGAKGWSIISLIALIGAITFTCLPEMFFGTYRKDHIKTADHRD